MRGSTAYVFDFSFMSSSFSLLFIFYFLFQIWLDGGDYVLCSSWSSWANTNLVSIWQSISTPKSMEWKKQFVILMFGKKQKSRNFFFVHQNVLFGPWTFSSILKKRERPKSMIPHSFNKRTLKRTKPRVTLCTSFCYFLMGA